jgi:type IV pilus assembly protein PilV
MAKASPAEPRARRTPRAPRGLRCRDRDGGFTLLEVLVAIVVLSLGLLGAAALVLSSIKNSHNAYLRSQASFLADTMAERMRANPLGVWRGAYNGALVSGAPALPSCGTGAAGVAGCNATQVAQRDRRIVADLLAQQLPSGAGSIACTVAGAAPATSYGIAPVDGSCTIAITWSEQRDVDRAGFGGTQRFELVVQP